MNNDKPVFKIEACCLLCARGNPEDGTVRCELNPYYRYVETCYCDKFMLRDLGYDVERA